MCKFFNIETSARILSNNLSYKKIDNKLKIYLSRQNSNYRNLINEGDLIDKLKSKNFMIIDTNNMSIFEQIKIFSSAQVIIGPTSSALTNIIFSNNFSNFQLTSSNFVVFTRYVQGCS